MRNKLWILNMILSNMINAFLIVYVMSNLETLGSVGVLLVLVSSSITALIISRLLLGKDWDNIDKRSKIGKWKLFFLIAAVGISLFGFVLNEWWIILFGFAFLIPVMIPNLAKIGRRWIK